MAKKSAACEFLIHAIDHLEPRTLLKEAGNQMVENIEKYVHLIETPEEILRAYLERRMDSQAEIVAMAAAMDKLGIVKQTRPLLEAMKVESRYEKVVNGHLTLPEVVEIHPSKLTHFQALQAFEYIIRCQANRWIPLFTDNMVQPNVFRQRTCDYAAKHGNLEVLQAAHQQKYPWSSKTTELAARHGKLNTLQFLRQHHCPLDEAATTPAAEGGHLDCLRYLHDQGIPWDAGATQAAAYFGYLDVLRYLYDNGCPMDEGTSFAAKRMGHLECLAFLREHHCPEVTNPRA